MASHSQARFKTSRAAAEQQLLDLLTRSNYSGPPNAEFLDTMVSLFESCGFQLLEDRCDGLKSMHWELPSANGMFDFQTSRYPHSKGLLSAIKGDKSYQDLSETDTVDSVSEESNECCREVVVTEKMLQDEAKEYRPDGFPDLMALLLRQKTRFVIVTAEAIPAIIKYYDLSTIKLLLQRNDQIIIPSMLLISLHGTIFEKG